MLTISEKMQAQSAWKVQNAQITFVIKNAGFKVDGSFSGFNAEIIFDANNLAKSSMIATIKSNTINTNNSWRDSHLKEDEYFGVEKYPLIRMESTKLEKISDTQFKGTFKLTIKNVTKSITLPFTFQKNVFKGSFTINRLDYGVGGKSITLSNEVTIFLEVGVSQ